MNKINKKATIIFKQNGSFLEIEALKIIWDGDQNIKHDFLILFPIFLNIKKWNLRKITKLLVHIYVNKENQINYRQNIYKKWWKYYEKRWFSLLENIFEIKLRNVKFKAYLGISPICPRDLVDMSFLIPYYATKQKLIQICAHETCHFYFYNKVFQILSVNKSTLYHSKYLWIISEMLIPIIFKDPQVIKLIGRMPTESYVCKYPLKKIEELYNLLRKNEISSDNFIKKIVQINIKENDINPTLSLRDKI